MQYAACELHWRIEPKECLEEKRAIHPCEFSSKDGKQLAGDAVWSGAAVARGGTEALLELRECWHNCRVQFESSSHTRLHFEPLATWHLVLTRLEK